MQPYKGQVGEPCGWIRLLGSASEALWEISHVLADEWNGKLIVADEALPFLSTAASHYASETNCWLAKALVTAARKERAKRYLLNEIARIRKLQGMVHGCDCGDVCAWHG